MCSQCAFLYHKSELAANKLDPFNGIVFANPFASIEKTHQFNNVVEDQCRYQFMTTLVENSNSSSSFSVSRRRMSVLVLMILFYVICLGFYAL